MAQRKPKISGADELVFVPLGGVGEIGMNLYLYGFGPADDRKWLMVDLGVTFPGPEEPGVDVILPDIRFIEELRRDLVGIVLTHAHEDHIGAVIDLWPRLRAPIYATPFTAELLKAKMAEEGRKREIDIKPIPQRSKLDLGPFALEFITVAHSIPEPNALAIRTPLGLVVHTADWKIDMGPITGAPTDEQRLRQLGDEGVDVLVCDSTNAMREGESPSEEEIGRNLAKVIQSAEQRVAVTIFASNVARIRSVAAAAQAAGRELVVAGRAMHRMIHVAQETGILPRSFKFHDQQGFGYFERNQIVLLMTGSQGEPRAALARVAQGEHPEISLAPDDLVIFSSRTIPGNEKAVGRIQNALVDQGVRIITDNEAVVHVTGHPRRGELKQMYQWVRPRTLVPMHGEARHLEEQGRFALSLGVPAVAQARNGRMLRFLPGPVEIIDEVPHGRLFRDGDLIIDGDDGPVRERRRLSFAGIVVVSVVVGKNGELVADPQVVIDGVPAEDAEGQPIADHILDEVEGALASIPKPKRRDRALLEEAARRAARAAVSEAWGKKPICKVLLTVV
ncbi:MAG: ribonuclease J [Hyphomicrobiaceae bacterium]